MRSRESLTADDEVEAPGNSEFQDLNSQNLNDRNKKLDLSENFQEYLFTGQQIQNQIESGDSPVQEAVENERPETPNDMMHDEDVNDMTDDNRF